MSPVPFAPAIRSATIPEMTEQSMSRNLVHRNLVHKGGIMSLALLATSPMQTVAASLQSDLKSSVYAKVKGWTVTRYTDADNKTAFCETIRITGSEQALRFTSDKQAVTMGFMGDASEVLDSKAPISVWFDADKENRSQEQFTLLMDASETYWRTLTMPNDEPSGLIDSVMNRNRITFGYAYESEQLTQMFRLTGTNAALKKLFECSRN